MARGLPEAPKWAWVVIGLSVIWAIVGSALLLNREPAATQPEAVAPVTEAPVDRLALAVVGDSVSEADSPDFSAGDLGSGTWVRYAIGDGIRFAGGYAKGGATTAQILPNVSPVQADVLVLLAGTNDSGQEVPFDTTAANLRQIAATVSAPRVVLSTIPPRDGDPAVAVEFNQQLQNLAAGEGWEVVDPMAGIRDGDVYATGMTSDGIHPTVEAARIIAAAIREQLLRQP